MYSVVAFFDEKTNEAIHGIWEEFKGIGINAYQSEVQGHVPHITLGNYQNNLDFDAFQAAMEKTYSNVQQIDLNMNVIGTFMDTGTIFIGPTMTRSLMDFHIKHHETFSPYHQNPKVLYEPEKWIPHLTLASELDSETLVKAFDYLTNKVTNIEACLKEVALVKVHTRIGSVSRVEKVYSVKLMEA